MQKGDILKLLVLRKPKFNEKYLHPQAMIKRNKYSQSPLPLKYKLNQTNQEQQIVVPFTVHRTWTGNLPIYREYKNRSSIPRTVIRHIEGDIVEFKNELSKVVSNAQIIEKVGRIEIQGSHKESVTKWLNGLGF